MNLSKLVSTTSVDSFVSGQELRIGNPSDRKRLLWDLLQQPFPNCTEQDARDAASSLWSHWEFATRMFTDCPPVVLQLHVLDPNGQQFTRFPRRTSGSMDQFCDILSQLLSVASIRRVVTLSDCENKHVDVKIENWGFVSSEGSKWFLPPAPIHVHFHADQPSMMQFLQLPHYDANLPHQGIFLRTINSPFATKLEVGDQVTEKHLSAFRWVQLPSILMDHRPASAIITPIVNGGDAMAGSFLMSQTFEDQIGTTPTLLTNILQQYGWTHSVLPIRLCRQVLKIHQASESPLNIRQSSVDNLLEEWTLAHFADMVKSLEDRQRRYQSSGQGLCFMPSLASVQEFAKLPHLLNNPAPQGDLVGYAIRSMYPMLEDGIKALLQQLKGTHVSRRMTQQDRLTKLRDLLYPALTKWITYHDHWAHVQLDHAFEVLETASFFNGRNVSLHEGPAGDAHMNTRKLCCQLIHVVWMFTWITILLRNPVSNFASKATATAPQQNGLHTEKAKNTANQNNKKRTAETELACTSNRRLRVTTITDEHSQSSKN